MRSSPSNGPQDPSHCPLREIILRMRRAVAQDDLAAFARLCASTPWEPAPHGEELVALAAQKWAPQGKLGVMLSEAEQEPQAQKNVADWVLRLAVQAGAEGLALRALETRGSASRCAAMLDHAMSLGWTLLPKALWEKGAPTTPQGMTEAMGAAIFGWPPSWRDWVERCDPLACDERGWTAAHFAAYHGNAEGLAALIGRGGMEAKNDGGRTPLEEAARGGQARCVELLADAGVFDPDSPHWKAAQDWGSIAREKQGDPSVAIALESRALAWSERRALAKQIHALAPSSRKSGL